MTTYLLEHLFNPNNTEWRVFIFVFSFTNFIVLFLTLLVGLAANVFVVWAVVTQKSLQTSNNALLVNLAIVDLIRCSVDCPLLMYIELRGHGVGHLDVLLCDVQMATFSFSCCVQLLTLACISVERYQAIASPFQIKERRRRIVVVIPVTWIVALILSVFCMSRPRDAPIYLKCNGLHTDKLPNYDTFGRYILIPIWSGCFMVVIGFYGRIFWIVRTHNKKIFDKGVPPPTKIKPTAVVDDGRPTTKKNNKSEENDSKNTDAIKGGTLKEDSTLVTDVRQPEAIQTKELISVQGGPFVTDTTNTTTADTSLNFSAEPSPDVIHKNNIQSDSQSQNKTERTTASGCHSSPSVTGAKKISPATPLSCRPNSQEATASRTSSPEVITKISSQSTHKLNHDAGQKTNSSTSRSAVITEQSRTQAETEQRLSLWDGKADTATITSIISLDARTSGMRLSATIKTNDSQPSPPRPQREKKVAAWKASPTEASVKQLEAIHEAKTNITIHMEVGKVHELPAGEGSDSRKNNVHETDTKSTLCFKIEEAQPSSAGEVPNNADAELNSPVGQEKVAGAVCMMASRERATKKKESKLAKCSGLIIQNSPHATTKASPSSLMLKRELRNSFDLLKPPTTKEVVKQQQEGQVSRRQLKAKDRLFEPGDTVLARNYLSGPKWVPATVLARTGPVSYMVQVGDVSWKRHVEQLLQGKTPETPDTPVTSNPGQAVVLAQDMLKPPVEPLENVPLPTDVPSSHDPCGERGSTPSQPPTPTPKSPPTSCPVEHTMESPYPARVRRAPKRLDL